MKSLSTLLVINILLIFTPCRAFSQSATLTQFVLPSKHTTISFEWQGDSVLSKWEPHTAMLIPVKLKGCPRTFYMQFDLGAPSSLFYKSKLDAIRAKYPAVVPVEDAGDKIKIFAFKAGSITITTNDIAVKSINVPTVKWDEHKKEIIGTIGVDLIDNKVLALDYPRKKIHVLSAVTEKLQQKISFSSFTYAGKSILLPTRLNGKSTLLFFDTGSSMFELLVNKETCLQLAITDAQPVRHEVKSWNRILMANTYASSASIGIAGTTLPVHSVTYIEGASNAQVERMLKAGIGGMTGNKLFLNYVLVLDTKQQQFGLMSSLKKKDME